MVNEGSSVFITEENINVLTSYYEDKIVDFLVVQQPKNGYIMFQQKPNNNVTIFTSMHLAQNKLKVSLFSVHSEAIIHICRFFLFVGLSVNIFSFCIYIKSYNTDIGF